MNGIADRGKELAQNHQHPYCFGDARIAADARGSCVTLCLPERRGRGRGVDAGAEHEDRGEEHNDDEATTEPDGKLRGVSA